MASRRYAPRLTTAGEPVVDIGAIPPPPPWVTDALCAQVDHDAFFPPKGGGSRELKAVCARCSVASQCLEYALENEELFSVWGGKSVSERNRILATRRAENPVTRVCLLDECKTVIDADAPRPQRYCTPQHASLQAGRNFAKRAPRAVS